MAESREEPLGQPQNGQIQPADDSTEEHTKQPSQITLPWGGSKDRMAFPPTFNIDTDIRPGEFVMRTLFAEFFVLAEQKIELVLTEPLERPLSKSLQRKEDTEFDQLLSTLGNVAEHCLPSLLRTLYKWFDRQCPPDGSLQHELKQKMKSKTAADRTEREYLLERRELAVDFLYCLVLIEVLKQLPFHPGQDDLISHLLLQAFRHFKYKDIPASSPNGTNVSTISDLYAEVIGVLAQSRFQAVRKKFMLELKELRSKDQSLAISQSAIISLLMGLKFFRVKMHPIEEFEACVHFLQELGNYFLEVREKDIKHALAGLFVEILLPVASVVKHEVNVPVLKNFVESLFTTTTEMSTRKKHQLALYPMLTCLLCVSQKSFFLANWSPFLTMCLTQLRNRDPKMSRVALESLYRLLWVYMIRIKCESNTTTLSKLQSISSSLFPKGGRSLIPKDTPLNIFVKIIQFVAQERLDFAMREIVFDLLCVGKPIRVVNPQRMSVGLRAFLVVADSLQQKDGEPPMPQTVGVMPSGNTLRVKKTFLNKMLTDGVAKTIGMSSYYPQIRKAFDGILRVLDREVGRNLAMTKPENVNKDLEELMIGERKAKIDLFRTCVAAIPRLFPEGMQKSEVVDLLTRLMIHVDEKLRELSLQALQNLVLDFPSWREDVLHGFIQFVQKEIGDSFPGQQHLDNFLRVLLQFLTQWKTAAQSPYGAKDKSENLELSAHKLPFDRSSHANVMNEIEGFALVMLCNCKPLTRKLAACILKEVRTLFSILGTSKVDDPCVIDVIDKAMPNIIEKLLPYLPSQEKNAIQSASNIDLQWLCERTSAVWVAGYHEHNITLDTSRSGGVTNEFDPWVVCLANFLGQDCLYTSCPHAIAHAWPIVYYRLQSYMDPNVNPSIVSDTRSSSILRSGSKKMASEKDLYNNLWRNYVVFACCIAPSGPGATPRCSSPELSSSPESSSSERSEPRSAGVITVCASNLFKQLTPLIRSDALDTRETIVNGLGRCNPDSFRALVEELVPYIKEAIDRKQEKVARRKKRDALRVLLVRIFKLLAENKTFAHSNTKVVDAERHTLSPTFVEYIDGARIFLDNEGDREQPMLQEIRVYFAGFVTQLIIHTPVEYRYCLLSRDLRYSLFFLFAGWSGRFGTMFGAVDRRQGKDEACTDFELAAVHAMSAVVCCGQVFDPSGLNEDGYLYSWLDVLLGTHDEKIYQLAQETVVLLLEFNPETQPLLDWVIDRVYTGTTEVEDGCFKALATVFQKNGEYPCDHVAMMNVALLNIGSPRMQIHDMALQLLQLLYVRFFDDKRVDAACYTPGRDTEIGQGETKHKETLTETLTSMSVRFQNSQIFLSEELARLHPDLTMPIFSEITHRLQTARPAIRQVLLQVLTTWLYNLEFVDPHLPPLNVWSDSLLRAQEGTQDLEPPLKGEGWGSQQATEMVLNNMFYITLKFVDDHPCELENLWSALVHYWPNNLRIIIRFMIIVTGMAPTELLQTAKLVTVYIARTRPDRLIEEIMNELQTIENLHFNIDRTETPPFFRLTNFRKYGEEGSSADTTMERTEGSPLEKGQIHTKRRSASALEERELLTPRTNSAASLRSVSSGSSHGSVKEMRGLSLTSAAEVSPDESVPKQSGEDPLEGPQPYPLPMPAYGGFYAPLNNHLPESGTQIQCFHRCNMAVMLLTDLIVDGLEIDWSMHLPLMFHIIFLGLDNNRSLVSEHCKKLLLNILLVLSVETDNLGIAKLILINKELKEEFQLALSNSIAKDLESTASSEQTGMMPAQSTISISSISTITPDNVSKMVDVDSMTSIKEVVTGIIDFMTARKSKPLWSFEDATSRNLTLKSAEQLEYLLKHVIRICKEVIPLSHVEHRWAQVALQLALSCSSRHYAGRSLQVFRALHVPLNTRMLSDILSRLVETVAEQGEDMQGYVTEIMLTLEAAVDRIDTNLLKPMDFTKDLFMSTPNLTREVRAEMRKSPTTVVVKYTPASHHSHSRSTSMSLSAIARRSAPVASSPPVVAEVKVEAIPRPKSNIEETSKKSTNLSRSRSAQSLKNIQQDTSSQDDKLTILAQMFWMAVSMLESDYEYEFLLAIRLLEKLLLRIQPERLECREKLDKIQQQIKWPCFPGLQALLLKGCTSSTTAEPTWSLLAKLTLCSTAPVVDPSQASGFPMNVVALLPYLVYNYEAPTLLCAEAAEHIAQMCMEPPVKMENLATVMTLYSRGTFNKDSHQWTKCVVKYLNDVYSKLSLDMINFLVEVLEKGPSCYQASVIQILHCIFNYIDMNTTSSQAINTELLRVIAKYIEGSHWREALKILKLAVTNTSTYTLPVSGSMGSISSDMSSVSSHSGHFLASELVFRRELPGRTMDFMFDMKETPLIGARVLEPDMPVPLMKVHLKEKSSSEEGSLDRKSSASKGSPPPHSGDVMAGWKRPQLSQGRTRERLVNLLTCYGQRVLPKSPSDNAINKVIFSQSSDTLERQPSICSSSEENSMNDGIPGEMKLDESSSSEIMVMKSFDFLNKEEEEDPESQVGFNWPLHKNFPSQGSLEGRSEKEGRTSKQPEAASDYSDEDEKTQRTNSWPLAESPSCESPVEEVLQQDLVTQRSIMVTTPSSDATDGTEDGRLRRHSSPLSGSTHSVHSMGSDMDIADLSPSNASPNFSNMAAAFLSIQSDEIEDIWNAHVTRIMTDMTGSYAVNTYQFFVRLYKELRRKLTSLTKEACYYLAKTEELRSIATQFLTVLELLLSQAECPHVFTEPDTLISCKLLQQHKFCVLEINETYETYMLRREQAIETLDSIKSSVKLQSLGENVSDFCGEEQGATPGSECYAKKMDLCKCLYRLHFQLVLLFESYARLVNILSGAATCPQIIDMSTDVTEVRKELVHAIEEVDTEQVSPLNVDPGQLNKENAEKMLVEYLTNQQYQRAVMLIRDLRSLWHSDVFGLNKDDDVPALLSIYCRHLAEKTPGLLVITKPEHTLGEVCGQLMEVNVQLSRSIQQLELMSREDREVVMKKPESSTL